MDLWCVNYVDLNVPALLASLEAATRSTSFECQVTGIPRRHGHKAKSDVLPEQLLTAVPGSKLYLGPTVHHCSAIVYGRIIGVDMCWCRNCPNIVIGCHWFIMIGSCACFFSWLVQSPVNIPFPLAALAHSVSIVKFRISHDMEQHINIFPYVHDDGIFIYSMIMWHLLDMFSIREAHISYFQGKRERESRYTRPGFALVWGIRACSRRLPRPKVSDSPANRERELLKSVREENFVQILGQCGELKS